MIIKLKIIKKRQTYLEDKNCRRARRVKILRKNISKNESID